jgi:hypothetical protein
MTWPMAAFSSAETVAGVMSAFFERFFDQSLNRMHVMESFGNVNGNSHSWWMSLIWLLS